MKKFTLCIVSVFLIFLFFGCTNKTDKPEIKNVILMISDCTSVTIPTLSRWYASYDAEAKTFDTNLRLNLDEFASGLIRTYWQTADGFPGAITDSAPGATAYATGYKSQDKFIGIGADKKPHATILELAKALGKSTGLIATSNLQHATPAAFAAHTEDRSKFELIAAQMLESKTDVLLGGGSLYMQNRADGRDLIAELKAEGYGYVTTTNELETYQGERLYGLFAPYYMAYDIDRPLIAPEQPSLSAMTEKALALLSKNKKGFFLMIEGSKVDWGAHNNDPVAVISEFLAFDSAVKLAMDFAKGREDTMVLVLEDHGTGGISIGSAVSDDTYSGYPLKDIIEPLSGAKITSDGAMTLLSQGKSAEEVFKLLGINDASEEELLWMKTLKPDPYVSTTESHARIGKMLSSRSNIGWTTTGHTGEDVILYSYLPKNQRITGLLENTDITKIICKSWGVELTYSVCPHFQN